MLGTLKQGQNGSTCSAQCAVCRCNVQAARAAVALMRVALALALAEWAGVHVLIWELSAGWLAVTISWGRNYLPVT